MGTIAQKFNYSFEAKDLIKDSINNLGGSITSETELKEYAQELDNIYDNLPKTTGEDTSLSLTTIKGKMNIIPKGDTQQTQYEGYNLFNPTMQTNTQNGITCTKNSDNTFTLNGTATADTTFLLGTYTIKDGETAKFMMFTQSESSTTLVFGYAGYGTSYDKNGITITRSGDDYTNNFYVRVFSGISLTNKVIKPMIVTNLAKTIDDYEPYVGGTASPNPTFPQNIEVVTGTQTITISNSDNTETQTQTISLGDIELCKIGTAQDYLYKSNDKWYKKENIEKIASYNGETITTDYISTTGQLTTGATIYYVLATPNDIEITNTTLIEQLDNLEKLKSYNGATNINCSGNLSAILSVSALKGE